MVQLEVLPEGGRADAVTAWSPGVTQTDFRLAPLLRLTAACRSK